MEIPRHWRLKKQRIHFTNLVTNPVVLYGIQEAIDQTVEEQKKELKPIKDRIRKEESVNRLRPPTKLTQIIFSSSK